MSSLRVLFVVVIGALLTSAIPWGERKARERAFKESLLLKNSSLNVICTHHKTGTFLMKDWMAGLGKGFERQLYPTQKDAETFYEDLLQNGMFSYHQIADTPVSIVRRLTEYGVRVRYLHVVRKPMDAVVSAYQYHKAGHECKGLKILCQKLTHSNETVGLEAAADYMWPILVEMTALAKIFSVMDNAVTLYLEELDDDFSGNFQRIIDFLYWPEGTDLYKVLDVAKLQQLGSSSSVSAKTIGHVSDPSQKPRLLGLLEGSLRWAVKLRELSEELEASSPIKYGTTSTF